MAQIKNVPVLRFRGFEEEWEEKRLGEVVEFFSGLTYSPKDVRKEQETLVLRSSNVKNGEIYLNDNVYVDSKVVNSENVRVGDIIVVVRNGSRSLIGKHAIVKKNMRDTVIGAFMTGVRYSESSFLNCLLDSPKFYTEIEKNLGATINQITTGAFKRMEFRFPKSLPEQNQIGNYFKILDEVIVLQEQKHTKLKQLKKAMLDKMFPKAGARIPEIRFNGFTEEWEEKKLGEVCNFANGYAFKSKFFQKERSKYIVLTPGNVKIEGGFQYDKGHYYNSSNKEFENYILEPNDIFITLTDLTPTAQTLGLPAIIPSDGNIYLHNQRLGKITNINVDRFYLFQFMCSDLCHNKVVLTASGTTVKHSSIEKIENLFFPFPMDKKEQQKIGAYFEELDKNIEGTQQQIEKYRNIKQALLSKMFV